MTENTNHTDDQVAGRTAYPEMSAPSTNAITVAPTIEEDDYGIAVWDASSKILKSSLSPTTIEGRVMISAAMGAADLRIRNVVKQTIQVINFMAHVVTLTDKQTFEVVTRVRLFLYLADGRTVSTMSEPCVKSFAFSAHHAGGGPFAPPLHFEVGEVPCGENRSYCTLREVLPNGSSAEKPGSTKRRQ